MTAIPFANRVIAYCLTTQGALSLRGARKRLWLELRRPETEKTYLDHQVRNLRRLHPHQTLKALWDLLPGDSIYDTVRVRIQSEELWPAYQLLYPRDRYRLSKDALLAAGLPGLAAAWMDAGHRQYNTAALRLKGPVDNLSPIHDWCDACHVPRPRGRCYPKFIDLTWDGRDCWNMIQTIKPLVHPTMRFSLRRPERGTQTFYAGS
jgi:hypothetical protein